MAIPLPLSDPAIPAEPGSGVAVLPAGRQRLAIVSTSNRLCGIAAYTDALARHLADVFEVGVFDLDQYLLRSRHRRVRAAGDRHIRDICRDIAAFDAVNLQVEYGTLGGRADDIRRRFAWLIEAAPRLSVTFHTLVPPPSFPRGDFVGAMLTGRLRTAADIRAEYRRRQTLSQGIAGPLHRVQRRKPVSIIVHNRRDARIARHLFGFDNVFDHPLTFMTGTEADTALATASRRRFPLLDALPADAKLVGVFGFLDAYKGFGTAIRALQHLPKDHHLLIFGGTHPNEIPVRTAIHPYVSSLFDDAYIDASLFDRISAGAGQGVPALSLDANRYLADLLGRHPRDLSQRIHFMGVLDDDDFAAGMAICDTVVFPYLEVGQSASGPIALALELGRRIIASRTHTFLEFAAYHREAIEFFDIGNHLELAKRLLARPQYPRRRSALDYNVETNKALYLAANSPVPDRRRARIAVTQRGR